MLRLLLRIVKTIIFQAVVMMMMKKTILLFMKVVGLWRYLNLWLRDRHEPFFWEFFKDGFRKRDWFRRSNRVIRINLGCLFFDEFKIFNKMRSEINDFRTRIIKNRLVHLWSQLQIDSCKHLNILNNVKFTIPTLFRHTSLYLLHIL